MSDTLQHSPCKTRRCAPTLETFLARGGIAQTTSCCTHMREISSGLFAHCPSSCGLRSYCMFIVHVSLMIDSRCISIHGHFGVLDAVVTSPASRPKQPSYCPNFGKQPNDYYKERVKRVYSVSSSLSPRRKVLSTLLASRPRTATSPPIWHINSIISKLLQARPRQRFSASCKHRDRESC